VGAATVGSDPSTPDKVWKNISLASPLPDDYLGDSTTQNSSIYLS